MTVEALSEFVMKQGMSKATNLMEWDQIWAINKQKIDPIVPRFAAVSKDGAVPFKLSGIDGIVCSSERRHPKNEEMGERMLMKSPNVFIDQEDAQDISEGEELTLLHWGNAFAEKITKDKNGNVTQITGKLNPGGDVKKTKKKIHWVANEPEHVTPLILRELDHIVTKEKIEDDDNIEDICNPNSTIDNVVATPLKLDCFTFLQSLQYRVSNGISVDDAVWVANVLDIVIVLDLLFGYYVVKLPKYQRCDVLRLISHPMNLLLGFLHISAWIQLPGNLCDITILILGDLLRESIAPM